MICKLFQDFTRQKFVLTAAKTLTPLAKRTTLVRNLGYLVYGAKSGEDRNPFILKN